MAQKGINKRDLPQLLTPEFALEIKNYIIDADGGLEKRGGLDELFDASANYGMLMLEKWTDDIYLFGYNTTLAAYRISTDTITDIKTDFVNSDMTGARYGDYFFIGSSGDKVGRVTFTLDYDGQTGNFATGLIVTGGTSGATAVILEDDDSGANGTLTLGNISGTFEDNEAITDSATGAAVVDGVLDFTYTAITNAPKAKIVRVVDTRLYAGNLETDSSAVKYSEVDDGTNPPFTTWNVGTAATDGGLINYRNAGAVNEILNLGNNIVVFCDEGKWAFQINIFDSAGTISKRDDTVMYRVDAGGTAAIQTDEGIFYVNAEGVWQLVQLGQGNVKSSDREELVSTLLGNKFFDDVTLSQASLVKDDKTNTLLIAVAQDSNINNLVLAYNTKMGAFSRFTGWNVTRFMNDDGAIYAGGSNTAKVWKIFEGNDDDGADIYYEFEQELNVGALWTRKELLGQYIQGELSPSTAPVIKFSIFDRTGTFIDDKLELQWNYGTSDLLAKGYGESSWGDPFGGDIDTVGTVENFAGSRERIKNFQRIRINISGHDQASHVINWFSVQTREKAPIRRRNLTKV